MGTIHFWQQTKTGNYPLLAADKDWELSTFDSRQRLGTIHFWQQTKTGNYPLLAADKDWELSTFGSRQRLGTIHFWQQTKTGNYPLLTADKDWELSTFGSRQRLGTIHFWQQTKTGNYPLLAAWIQAQCEKDDQCCDDVIGYPGSLSSETADNNSERQGTGEADSGKQYNKLVLAITEL
ncbi:hypothetical protein Pmani_010896 [Petrolisthes manimaculis]|uniref:Uncharacterized protein n=1 Tax=Petrolisthes manimaculis TaxID=1843537 RepID=A0AAE1Q260_9EUCA|nr:hypothetical protein Pmani_010896 [Petrolisthes manimaculis]